MHDTKNLCNYLANLNDDIQSAVMYLREHPELSDEDFAATVQTTEEEMEKAASWLNRCS